MPFADITPEQYHAILDRDSHHSMLEWEEDPKLYVRKRIQKQQVEEKKTADMVLGSALHCLALEPNQFDRRYACLLEKVDRRTNIGKAKYSDFLNANVGKDVLTADDYDSLIRMANAMRAHPVSGRLLSGPGVTERPVFWDDPETGLPMRMMADKIMETTSGTNWCVDLKTVQDYQAVIDFGRTIHKWKYHRQAALYIDGLWHGINLEVSFAWIVVTKSDPVYVAVCALADDAEDQTLRVAREENLRIMRDLARRRSDNDWMLDMDVQPISVSVPFYAMR